jgi:hypothetical protein
VSTWKPVAKVTATALGGALATLLVWLLGAAWQVDVPAEAAAALAAVLAFAAGYLKAPAEEPTGDAGHSDALGLLLVLLAVVLILAVVGVL